ncbi:hypothetical protein [Mycobacterium sp.]|nr:hypothetical protein [Mycobacterium sp.]HME46825.1 hypothetical protein [Mycobacterium sp.]
MTGIEPAPIIGKPGLTSARTVDAENGLEAPSLRRQDDEQVNSA